VNSATLVAVISGNSRILDDLDGGQFARLLVVLDVVSNLQVQLSVQRVVQVGEEFRLEHAVDKRVRLLWTANHN
jgi:hypothetical protein